MTRYKAQFLVPVTVEFDALSDDAARQQAEEMSLRRIMKGDAQYPDLGYHALIAEDGRTIDET